MVCFFKEIILGFSRKILRQVLRAFNVRQIREADNTAEALKILKSSQHDIILFDYNVTPLNGVEFSKVIRTDPDPLISYLALIMVTAYSEKDVVCQARDAGVDEFLTKPISAHSLYARLVAVIERRRAFVRCKSYIGPDRHRHDDSGYRGPKKRDRDNEDERTPV